MDNFENSRIEKLIHMSWFPEWHVVKIKNYTYNFKNINFLIEDVLEIELGLDDQNDELEDQMKDLLIIEIIASTMFLTEVFASLVGGLKDQPDNLQQYLKNFKATDVYSTIDKLSDDDYIKILSIPPVNFIDEDGKNLLLVNLTPFKEILIELKEYYFSNLDLFNSYKHGFRIFPLLTSNENGDATSTIMQLCREQNVARIHNFDKDIDKYLKISELTSGTFRILLNNLENKLKNPNEWKVCIPAKRPTATN